MPNAPGVLGGVSRRWTAPRRAGTDRQPRNGRHDDGHLGEFRDLQVVAVRKSFGAAEVLRGADLAVESGRTVALLGPSGCGKTTLMRVVAGLEVADTGEVRLGGRLLTGEGTHVAPEFRRIGLLGQERSLFPHLSVGANVAYGLPRSPERARRVAEVLDLVDLADFEDRMPDTLSGGQQQRVALARALAPGPRVLLLDEPFQGLDSNLRLDLQREVRVLLQSLGATAVIVTHDQDEAFVMGDEVAVMAAGRICQRGTPDEVYARPLTPWVAGFVGDVNFLPGVGAGGAAVTALGEVAVHGDCSGEISVLVRPSHLRLEAPGNGVAAVGTVEELRLLGHATECKVRLGDLVLLARSGRMPPLRVGDEVGVSYDGPPTMAYSAAAMAESARNGTRRRNGSAAGNQGL
ncbi:MAG: ABC transporter ATP-binding protein [bacterium]|nr:ABC transporter ATP-binding protein [bacterium]